jgi:hypothetical protein
MNRHTRKRVLFRPSISDQRLEDRLVLSTGAGAIGAVAPVTPRPAPSPVSAAVIEHAFSKAGLRRDFTAQFKAASAELRAEIDADISQLFANGPNPTAQQTASFRSAVDRAIDAIALQDSAVASVLPGSDKKLVPTIQNELLGSSPTSLVSRLDAISQSSQLSGSLQTLDSVVNHAIAGVGAQTVAQATTFVNAVAVNSVQVQTALATDATQTGSLTAVVASSPTVASQQLQTFLATLSSAQLVQLTATFTNALASAFTTAELNVGLTIGSGFFTIAIGSNTTNTGANLTNTGANLTNTGANLTNNGANLTNTGANLTNTGANLTNTGANLTNTGANLSNTGANLSNTGANLSNTGANLTNTGANL